MSRKSLGGNKAGSSGSDPNAGIASASDPVIELESQFILRLPEEPAAALRAALRAGAANIKERLSISLKPENPADPRLRRAIVEFDSWTNMSAKLMDLPTVVESHKTIDRKSFYKTADICQMLWAKEGEASDDEEEERAAAAAAAAAAEKAGGKKYDPNKVEKKWVYPHGVTPPLKNCRKRRFRKTLKKRYIDAPENEKEVKHLLRQDLDAVRFSYDLVTEDEIKGKSKAGAGGSSEAGPSSGGGKKKSKGQDLEGGLSGAGETTLDENDIFGQMSDSDEDMDGTEHNTSHTNIDVDDSDGNSNTLGGMPGGSSSIGGPTEFSSSMFAPSGSSGQEKVSAKAEIVQDIALLRKRKSELESNIATCDNLALLHRFKASLAQTQDELRQKEDDLEGLSMF